MERSIPSIPEMTNEEVEREQALLGTRRQEYSEVLRESRRRVTRLEIEQKAALARVTHGEDSETSMRKEQIAREINLETQTISDMTEGLLRLDTIQSGLSRKLKRNHERDVLEAFDLSATKLVNLSTRIGELVSQIGPLMQESTSTANELNRITFEAIPQGSQFRKEWGSAAGKSVSIGPQDLAVKISALDEAATLGEFVKGRVASLRSFLVTALKR